MMGLYGRFIYEENDNTAEKAQNMMNNNILSGFPLDDERVFEEHRAYFFTTDYLLENFGVLLPDVMNQNMTLFVPRFLEGLEEITVREYLENHLDIVLCHVF